MDEIIQVFLMMSILGDPQLQHVDVMGQADLRMKNK
jgi:hypothetical protein